MDREKLIKYADLLLKKGAGLQKGQPLLVTCSTDGDYFAEILAERAYEMGASEVEVKFSNDSLERLKYIYADTEIFKEIPQFQIESSAYYVKKGACIVHLRSSDPDNLRGIETEKIKAFTLANSEAQAPYKKLLHNMDCRSVIACIPSLKWAQKVFPQSQDPIEDMWQAILFCTYADKENPIEYWEEHVNRILKRCQTLTDMHLTSLHFTSQNGTDLMVDLAEDCIWGGGGSKSKNGVFSTPNIPTQESFTCPHKDRVNGKVVATKPLSYKGGLIEDFSIEYKDGKVVSFNAKTGENILSTILFNDEGTQRLGEVALVDFESPINKTGRLFYNTLYDENAVCHLAIGSAYPFTVDMSVNKDKSAEEKGLNKSKMHIDFMFGTADMLCVGTKGDGTRVTVMENGKILY